MDYRERIAKLEASVETLRTDTDRLLIAIAELRDHTDQAIAKLRDEMDLNFRELRKEISVNMRWQVGLILANTALIVSLYAKVLGYH